MNKIIKTLIAFVMVVAFSLGSSVTNNLKAAGEEVTIVDGNLRAVIENRLGLAAGSLIIIADMESLTYLTSYSYSSDDDISSLERLEYAVNLTRLEINNYASNIGTVYEGSDKSIVGLEVIHTCKS